jgi:hypothetical protein
MSIPDVATLINIRSWVPNLTTAEPSAVFVRRMLRVVTGVIFVAATVIGVQFAAAAPAEPPVSTSVSHP